MTITIAGSMLDPWCTITPPQILPTVSALGAATSARSHACTKWQLTQSMHSKLARPWRLYMRNGFLRRNQNPSLKWTGSSFPTNPVCQLLLFKKHHLKIFGCFFCDLFSLLSSRFSRCCSFLRAFFALLTSNFSSGHRLRCQQPRFLAATF